jgi:membrane protein YqaA with SNARE-associated domain
VHVTVRTGPTLRTAADKRALPAGWIAFAWGILEATVFFIVPDVFLTALALRRVKPALVAALAATAGAMLGGIVMYEAGQHAPDAAHKLLCSVPGIDAGLVADVRNHLDEHGYVALVRGLFRGRPYKIYAVECGANSSGLASFLAMSAFARMLRFVASVLLARGVTLLIARWTRQRARVELAVWALFWIGFYAFYFAAFGW